MQILNSLDLRKITADDFKGQESSLLQLMNSTAWWPKNHDAVNTLIKDLRKTIRQQNNNLQNALFELDSAQVEVRNQLLDAKAKYAEVDNQFKLIKDQRKMQKKVVKDYEKRIKTIESTKEKIRNTMQIE